MTNKLSEAIAWFEDILRDHNDPNCEFGITPDEDTDKLYVPIGHMRRMVEAARTIEMLEALRSKLPETAVIKYHRLTGDWWVSLGDDTLPIWHHGKTEEEALRAALDKIGGVG